MPVDVNQALDLKYNHHLSYKAIAAIQGVTPQAIHQKIKDLLPIPETQVYQDHRADILSNLQLKLLYNLDDEKIKAMGGRDIVVSAGILYDKERLERGQSTQNVEIHAITEKRKAIQSRIEELRAKRDELEKLST